MPTESPSAWKHTTRMRPDAEMSGLILISSFLYKDVRITNRVNTLKVPSADRTDKDKSSLPKNKEMPGKDQRQPCSIRVAILSIIASCSFFSGSKSTLRFIPKKRPKVCQKPALNVPRKAFTMLKLD